MDLETVLNWLFPIVYVLALLVVIGLAAWRTVLSETEYRHKAFSQMLIYYGLYLFWILIPYTLWQWWTDVRSTPVTLLLLGFSVLMIYSRFIEPSRLVTRYQTIRLNPQQPLKQPLRVVLIADLHVGLFSGQKRQLRKIVERVNAAKADMVLVAGDWTYEPGPTLLHMLDPLRHLNGPVFSVPGNHDEELPGPPLQQELKLALEALNIVPLEGHMVEFDQVRLLGTGDLWAGKADLHALRDLPQDKPWLVLAHNPDTVDHIPDGLPNRPLMLSGHTHGGQVDIPWLTAWALRKESKYGFQVGLYDMVKAQVYVTAGTGMVAVPFRCGMPPTIDVLELT